MTAFLRFVRARYNSYNADLSYKSYTADILKRAYEVLTQSEIESRWIELVYKPEEFDIEAEREKAIKAFSRG